VKILAILLVFAALASLAGCPVSKKDGQEPGAAPGAQGNPATQAQQAQPSAPGQPAAEAQAGALTGMATEDLNGIWVKPHDSLVKVNQWVQIEYNLVPPPNGDAWIALVPSAVTSKVMKDNIAQVVDRVTLGTDAHGRVELHATKPGAYFIRLFPAQLGDLMAIAESSVNYTDQPLPGEQKFTPPYVDIADHTFAKPPEQVVGRPMIAYWELLDVPGDHAWVGLIPTSCTAKDAKANQAAAVDIQYLEKVKMNTNMFYLSKTGEYVFRIFPSEDPAAQMICESQPFKVIPEAKKAKPGKQSSGSKG
jgi:hypothetical protein